MHAARHWRAASLVVLTVLAGFVASPAEEQRKSSGLRSPRRPEFDALATVAPVPGLAARAEGAAHGLRRAGSPFHADERLGVPMFLWASQEGSDAGLARARASATAHAAGASGRAAGPAAPLRPEEAARGHLDAYRDLYGLDPGDVTGAEVTDVHDLGRGPIIVRLRQPVDGIEVFREEMSLVMDRSLDLVAISGHMPAASQARGRAASAFRLSRAEAVAIAYSDLSGRSVPAAGIASLGSRPGNYESFDLVPGLRGVPEAMTQPARVKPVWFRDVTGLVAAFYVEVDSANDDGSDNYAYVVSAEDGRLLFRHDLTEYDANSYSYRVWAATPGDPANPSAPFDGPQGNLFDPHPFAAPNGVQPPGAVATNDVTITSSPYVTDPWLPIGALESVGNNADAYADITGADGYTPATGDYRADLTGPNAFLRSYDPANPGALDSRKAALIQMFYNVNFFHDWYYVSGFTEAAGNAQASNYGRGGVEGDSIRAEGQDQSGRNNANMNTPADGGRPRMQMFLFDGIADRHTVVSGSSFGPNDYATGLPSGWGISAASAYDVTAELVWVNDGVGSSIYPPSTTTTTTIHDGCNYTPGAGGAVDPNWAPVTGRIAFIDRGGAAVAPATCGFQDKAFNATRAGAVAVIIASTTPHAASTSVNMAVTAGAGTVTIPALQLSTPDGDAIRTAFGAGTVTAHLTRAASIDRDGTVDTQIMAHEWGHYISNRLVANASGLTTGMARGMGEGWADFHGMLLTVKAEDRSVPGNDQYGGVYGQAVWVTTGGANGPIPNQGVYFGIRRMPYSTDMTKNNMTYRNIQDNSAIPVGVPFAFWPAPGTTAANGGNSEVHNTGEVWATMLWECYAALLRDSTPSVARLTFTEARDRMKDYLVAAYKLTPPQPTFLEARDALLAAVYAGGDTVDYNEFLTAFAKRGAGFGAISPDRFSATNNGVVESFTTAPNLVFAGASITDDTTTCDTDGNLDTGEVGHLAVRLRNDSVLTLSATSATVSAIGPNAANVTFPGGNVVSFTSTNPLETATGSIAIGLVGGLTSASTIDLSITFDDSALSRPQTVAWSRRGNVDEVVGQSFTDDVESNTGTNFTQVILAPAAGGQNLPVGWFRNEITGTDHNYRAADLNGPSDLTLLSPSISIGTDPVSIGFKHRYSLEFSGTQLFDGGVVEISKDAGNTWADVTSFPGVTVTGQAYTNPLANTTPLGTRRAFGGLSPGYPAYVNTTFNLGTQLASSTILVRFRLVSDANARADGWEIDDITVTGAAARPFRALLPNKCAAGQTNRRPTAAIAPQGGVPERSPVTLSGATSSDLDGDALQYFWAQLSGTPVVITQSPGSPTMSFTAPDVAAAGASVVMTLTVSDGTAFSTTVTRTVSVTNVDRPPVASAGTNQTVDERTIVTLNGSASSDPDGDALSYAWIQTAGPSVTLQGATTASPLFIAPDVAPAGATLTFQLTVTASGVPASASVNVTVNNVNRAPTANAGSDHAALEGSLAQLFGSANDPDGDALTYAWTQISPASPVAALSNAAVLQPTFTAPDVTADTAFTFQLSVSDGLAPAVTSQVTVTVQACPQPLLQVNLTMVTLSGGKPVVHFQDPNPPANVTGYDLYRSPTANGPWFLVAHNATDADPGTPDIQVVDVTGNQGDLWFYRVAAFSSVCGLQGPW
ncbi:MAG TPA: M36 family metallopeptidase [Verrucomicrobiae bacterium]|nr:M36 family metallopeptidase [Verrucomicrobiae bacterium]